MPETVIYADSLQVSLKLGPDIVDITHELKQMVRASGIVTGMLAANMVGSTGSLTTTEYEPGVVEDLKRAVERMAPRGLDYEHEKAWHDGNGHSHVQAALMGPSISIAVRSGKMALGTWQQVVAVNHDNRARKRTVEITIIGH
ncbi:MAG: secondary thiamine-phosphate synthase enzyme YjbQ [Desulfobacterales bacterium]|nr:secondary thiamine-phosphate synthase enzyme YjbQ [Desulfobacterales bacterium]